MTGLVCFQVHVEFDLYIEDVNDESPVFKNEPYRLAVPEVVY